MVLCDEDKIVVCIFETTHLIIGYGILSFVNVNEETFDEGHKRDGRKTVGGHNEV